MTKIEVDSVFGSNYLELLSFAKEVTKKKRKNFDAEIVLSELYLLIDKKKETFESGIDLVNFSKGFIRNEVVFFNSKTNRNERNKNANFEDFDNFNHAENWQDFKIKINEHEQEVTMEVVLDLYKKKKENVINKRLLEMYMSGQTCRGIAEKFGISKSEANREIVKMKKDVLTFAESLKKVII